MIANRIKDYSSRCIKLTHSEQLRENRLKKKDDMESGDIAQRFRAFAALIGDLGSVLNSGWSQPPVPQVPGELMPAPGFCMHVFPGHALSTHTHIYDTASVTGG